MVLALISRFWSLTKSAFGFCARIWLGRWLTIFEEPHTIISIGCFTRGYNSYILSGKMKSKNVIFAGVAVASVTYAQHTSERPIQIKNESGSTAEIYWVDPSSKRMVLQNPSMANGQTLALSK